MEWSNELILEFIGLYEKNPVLWNPNHPSHKNRNTLSEAWRNIAWKISAEVTVDVLKRKKESLMATYRSLAKKLRDSEVTGSGAEEGYVPSWFAYDALDRFVRDTRKKIPPFSSEKTKQASQNEQDSSFDQDELYDPEEAQGQDTEPSFNFLIPNARRDGHFVLPQSRAINKRKGSPNIAEEHIAKQLQPASESVAPLVAPKSRAQPFQDAPALYGQLLAAKLRRLSLRAQLILQNKIDNLVFEAELSELDGASFISTQFVSPESSTTSSDPSPIVSDTSNPELILP